MADPTGSLIELPNGVVRIPRHTFAEGVRLNGRDLYLLGIEKNPGTSTWHVSYGNSGYCAGFNIDKLDIATIRKGIIATEKKNPI
jgi:hypothetical protein